MATAAATVVAMGAATGAATGATKEGWAAKGVVISSSSTRHNCNCSSSFPRNPSIRSSTRMCPRGTDSHKLAAVTEAGAAQAVAAAVAVEKAEEAMAATVAAEQAASWEEETRVAG